MKVGEASRAEQAQPPANREARTLGELWGALNYPLETITQHFLLQLTELVLSNCTSGLVTAREPPGVPRVLSLFIASALGLILGITVSPSTHTHTVFEYTLKRVHLFWSCVFLFFLLYSEQCIWTALLLKGHSNELCLWAERSGLQLGDSHLEHIPSMMSQMKEWTHQCCREKLRKRPCGEKEEPPSVFRDKVRVCDCNS